MSAFLLTEDSQFNYALEDGSLLLQEFLGVSVPISGTGEATVSTSVSFNRALQVVGTGALVVDAIKATTISVSISAVGRVFVAAEKARSVSALVSARGLVSTSVTPSVNVSANVVGRGIVGASTGGAISVSVQVIGVGDVTLQIRSTRPEPITNFRISARSSGSLTLLWQNGFLTDKVEIWRATGARGVFSRIAIVDSPAQTYNDSISLTETYAYQLIPISATSAKGRNSNIIYSATDKIL